MTELEKEYSNVSSIKFNRMRKRFVDFFLGGLVVFYLQLTISDTSFFNNILNILKWDSQRQSQMLRKPVEKHKWATEPAVVNAFYNPNRNDIVFPAGILQQNFYSKNFPKSLNYGGKWAFDILINVISIHSLYLFRNWCSYRTWNNAWLRRQR